MKSHASGRKPDPLVGLTIDGKYTIRRRIGTGGFGWVYEARETATKLSVAIKILNPRLVRAYAEQGLTWGNDPAAFFLREGRVLTSLLDCPNIVRVIDFGVSHSHLFKSQGGVTATLHYIVTNRIVGETVSRLQAGQPMPFGKAVYITLRLGEALSYAHSKGICHRDIKADNVLVAGYESDSPVVTLLDFGVSKSWRGGTLVSKPGTKIGTPSYMAPETVYRGAYSIRSEVWALGMLLYKMLTGRLPFMRDRENGNPVETIKAILKEPLPRMAKECGVPAMIEAVVRRALRKNPAKRFQSVAAFCEALNRAHEAENQAKADRSEGVEVTVVGDQSAPPEASPPNVRLPTSGGETPERRRGRVAWPADPQMAATARLPKLPRAALSPQPLLRGWLAAASLALVLVLGWWLFVSMSKVRPMDDRPIQLTQERAEAIPTPQVLPLSLPPPAPPLAAPRPEQAAPKKYRYLPCRVDSCCEYHRSKGREPPRGSRCYRPGAL